MAWFVLSVIAGLAAFAYGWVTVRTSRERVMICLELQKIAPVVDRLKQGAFAAVNRGRQLVERDRRR